MRKKKRKQKKERAGKGREWSDLGLPALSFFA
jgi:hypothetical protein